MKRQRLIAVFLIGIQAAVLWYFTRTLLFPIAMVVASLAAFAVKWRLEINRRTAFWACIALFLSFVMKYFVAPHQFGASEMFIRTQLFYAIGQFFLTLQMIQFYVRRPDDRLPATLPALGIVTMVCFGDVQPGATGLMMFQVAVLGLIFFSAFYGGLSLKFSHPRSKHNSWGKAGLGIMIILVVLGTGVGTSITLRQHERDFDAFIARYLLSNKMPSQVGFSGKARLGSVAKQKATASQQISLQVFADEEPGYLRGLAFDSYAHGEWTQTGMQRGLIPVVKPPPGIQLPPSGHQTFVAAKSSSTDWRELEVRPQARQLPVVFSPLGTSVLQAPIATTAINDDGVFTSRDLEQGVPFYVGVTENPDRETLSAETRARLTAVPNNLDPSIPAMVAAALGRLQSDEEKIAAVQGYFAENYEYQIGITVPPGRDPLNYFLLEQPPAHCEYFAAGAAVLLRLAGVPCRYVTGFVAVEENSFGDYWVARNKDAHAWVEAYDEERGWVTVEATPPSGIPHAQKTPQAKQLWEYLRETFQALVSQIGRGDFRAFAWSVVQFFGSMPGLICVVLGLGYLLRHRLGQWKFRRVKRDMDDPLVTELRRLLKQMDARMSKQKLHRNPGETLHRFADRIASVEESPAALWYRAYASLRYGGELSRIGVEQLATELKQLRRG